MVKRILFFSCEPGGAEVLIPVIKLMSGHPDYKVIVTGYGYALKRFKNHSLACIPIKPIRKNDFVLFDAFQPDIIITSACSSPFKDMSEKNLWYNARLRKVKTLAFLDQWQNYTLRFSGPEEKEQLFYIPDYINCINEIGRAEMMAEGFDDNQLIMLGHPYLTSQMQKAPNINRMLTRKQFNIASDCQVYLFVSEAIEEYYGRSRGYNQYDALRFLLDCLEQQREKKKLIVKLHPKDDIRKFADFPQDSIIYLCDELSPLECIVMGDFICGMSSIMLIEAYNIGKQVMSIQPNLNQLDPFILSRYSYVPLVKSEKDFARYSMFSTTPGKRFSCRFDEGQFLVLLNSWLGGRTVE